MPPDPPISLAYLYMYTYKSDIHVTPLLKFLATGLQNLLLLDLYSVSRRWPWLPIWLPSHAYCPTCLKNLKEQLFPHTNRAAKELFKHGATSQDKAFEINMQRMLEAIKSHWLFYNSATTKQRLWNFLANRQLMNSRMICSLSEALARRSLKATLAQTFWSN